MGGAATGEAHRLPADVADRVPNGWYRLDPDGATALDAGEVVGRTLGGREIVLWPGPDGVVAADAHCPHLGAHLGHGGTVEDGCLRCPFHGWRWGPDGAHLEIPGHDTVTNARLGTIPVREVDGGVLVWFGRPEAAWEPAELTAEIPADAVDLGGLDGSGEGLHLAMMEG
ncbi:MAG: Rieske 2Fe-2S domain-containing protein, partial [Actinomycetota bacterium]